MIDKNVVKKLVDEWLQDQEYFLVDIEISPDNRIVVEIDHADGVWIEDCVALSRYIEERLSRDDEDYEPHHHEPAKRYEEAPNQQQNVELR